MLILLLEPNTSLREAITEVLSAENYEVAACDSLEQVMRLGTSAADAIGLVAWQSMEGLLADHQREALHELTGRLRLVLMLPRRWKRLIDQSAFGFVATLPKPFGADELLQTLEVAIASKPGAAQPAN